VDIRAKYFHQAEREKEEKTPSTYTEHLKTENVNFGVTVQPLK
jgi:hypothetical protein